MINPTLVSQHEARMSPCAFYMAFGFILVEVAVSRAVADVKIKTGEDGRGYFVFMAFRRDGFTYARFRSECLLAW